MKFCLREQVQKFQTMISHQEGKISNLNKKARELAQNNNKNSAKAALREIIEKDKKIISIRSRKILLENQITQLQFNEMNKSTMLLLEESNKVYQQTEIDSIKLEEIMYFSNNLGKKIRKQRFPIKKRTKSLKEWQTMMTLMRWTNFSRS